MRIPSWSMSTSTPPWRGAWLALWLLGGGLVCVYAIMTLADFRPQMDWLDWAARLVVAALFAAALFKGRRRFQRYPTIKYFCITGVTTVFLLLMDATRFNLIPVEDYRSIVLGYLFVVLFLASRRGETRKR